MIEYFIMIDPVDVWRDTVIIPPYGIVKIWIQMMPSSIVNPTGKSVFHCYFLAHEDTGMIAAIKWTDPAVPA